MADSAAPVTVDGFVAEIMLSRPETLNRVDATVHEDLAAGLAKLSRLDGIRAAVIGSTGRAFSAGGDFDLMLEMHADFGYLQQHTQIGRQILWSLIDLPFPVVAAVQGPAIGLGASIALLCDIVVAARSATFADPHVQVGLAPGDGGCLIWPQAAGLMRAKRYLLTGDRLTAEQAYSFGLITDLVDEPDDTLPKARELAQRLASLPPVAVQSTKRILNNTMRLRAAEVVELAMACEVQTLLTDDLVEAVAAAREHRRGTFQGR